MRLLAFRKRLQLVIDGKESQNEQVARSCRTCHSQGEAETQAINF